MRAHPPIFVINLARASDRRKRMARLLREMNLTPRFFSAVDGRKLDDRSLAFWHRDARRQLLNPGEVGCMLSHIEVWRQIVAEKVSSAIVLEDDLCIAPTFSDVVAAANDLEDFGLVRLETEPRFVVTRVRPTAKVAGHRCHALRRDGAFRSGAYLISRKVALQLVSASKHFTNPIDAELFDRHRSAVTELPVQQLVPGLCQQAESCPETVEQAPFLQSAIDPMGQRADETQGWKRPDEPQLIETLRAVLRPMKQIAANAMLLPFGWQRRMVKLTGTADPTTDKGYSPRVTARSA
ncbi:glycosyltransferase family 25 protein [Novosphingobium malaysiense]|uniref:glycosyltransferase family 25 protein n=1 Tax=Novosphingobium malaysiense TaxID=1348853 RepID=UPI00068E5166|nr:glycosyltransferase family 25 protein [Novosphingobium malaysiense]